MKAGFGEWTDPGKHKQIRFQTLYSDGWLLVRTADGREQHVEPQDIEPDPYYEGH